jgi:general secretion pathway protein C
VQGQLKKATQEWTTLFINLPWQKWLHYAPQWTAVLLVVLVAKSASDMTWLIFAPEHVKTSSAGNNQSARVDTQTVQHRLRGVAEVHLFGVASKPVINKAAPIEAKKTGLKLTLRGVFAANSPNMAMALIADARGKEKVYRKSDTIFSGVRLYEIYPDKVILERSGNFETLYFTEQDKTQANRVRTTPSYKTRKPVAAKSGKVRTRNIRASKTIKESLEVLSTDPQKFMQEARIEPVFDDNNQIKGYTFDHNDRRLISSLGLRKGDVIVEINGQSVSDPSTLTTLFTQLNSISELSLLIERNGRRENLNITM